MPSCRESTGYKAAGGSSAGYVCKIRAIARCETGQSTVEFAIVFAAFVCVVLGLGALLGIVQDDGPLVLHALASASHHVAGGDVGAWGDVLAF